MNMRAALMSTPHHAQKQVTKREPAMKRRASAPPCDDPALGGGLQERVQYAHSRNTPTAAKQLDSSENFLSKMRTRPDLARG